MIRELPEGAELLSIGLYIYRYQIIVGGIARTLGELYSTEGYWFYDNEAEVYDEEGNLIAPEDILPSQRLYMQYRTVTLFEAAQQNAELAARFISVPVDDSYEIISIGNPTTTI